MANARFSASGKAFLLHEMDEFPAILREQLVELIDDMDMQSGCILEVHYELCSVMLDGIADPAKKIALIKLVRAVTGLGLAEAKSFVEEAPKLVKENLTKQVADELKRTLEDAGGRVSIK